MKLKPRSLFVVSSLPLAICLAFGSLAHGALFWDGGTTNIAGNGDGASAGGTGTWDATIQNWDAGVSPHVAWTSGNDAVFGGTAGIVTIASGTTLNVHNLTFGVGGYNIVGADATSTLNFSGTTPTIAGSGKTFFTVKFTGTAGLTLSSGNFNVLANDLSGLSGTVFVNARATLQGVAWAGSGVGASVLSGSQYQEWNVTDILTSNNKGTGATIQLGALSGSGLVRNGNDGDGSPLSGIDTFQVGALNTSTTYSGKIEDFGGAVAALIKVGTGTLTLSGVSNYTGATTIGGGTLVVGASGANDGSTSALGRVNAGKTITISAGATLTGTANNWFGNQANVGTLPTITVNGGTLSTSRYTTIGALTLNGATVTNTATDTNNYQAFAFRGDVTVGGSSASTISANAATATTQGYHLGSNTTFTVADATGNANADLIISAPLRDQSGDFGNAAGGLTKSGAGTLALTGASTYTGGTSITAGVLSVGEVGSGGADGTNTSLGSGSINVASAAQLIFAGNNLSIANNVTLNGAATVNSLQGALVGGRQDGTSNSSLSGTLTLAGTGDRTVSTWWSDKTLALSGKVTGTGTLRIVNATNGGNGGSIVYLSNATNDFSGGIAVDSGGNGSTQTLRLGASNVIPDGAGKGDVAINGRLELSGFADTINGLSGSGVVEAGSTKLTVGNNDATSIFSGGFYSSAGGGLVKTGSGTLTFSGAGDNSGARAQVNAGTLVLAKTNSASAHAVGANGGTDYALVITGGTAQLGGTGGDQIYQNSAVNMTGGIFDLAGLSEGFDGLSGSGGTITNSTVSTTSMLTLGQNNSSGSPSFGGIIQNGNGTVALTKTGTGTQTLTGNNTYNGNTNVDGGILSFGGGTSTTGGGLLIHNGTVNIAGGTFSTSNYISVGNVGSEIGVMNVSSGSITTGSDFNVADVGTSTGTLNVSGSGLVVANGASLYVAKNTGTTGTVNLNGGTISAFRVGDGNGTPGTSTFNFNGGTLKALGNSTTFMAGHDTANVRNGGALIDTQAFNITIGQALSHSNIGGDLATDGGLAKSGSGTLTLTGNNTYTGVTNVNVGTLVFSGGGSVYNGGANAGNINVNNGGTLRLDRLDIFGGHTSVPTATITVNSGGLVSGNGFFNTLNNLTLNGGTLQTANGDSFWGSFALKGTVTVGGASASTISSGGSTNNYIRIGTNTAGGTTIFNVADSTGNANTDLTISAQLSNNREPGGSFNEVAGVLTKNGAGTLTLSGANSYSGGTTINVGTITIGNNTALGSGIVTMNDGTTLANNSATALTLGNAFTLSGSTNGLTFSGSQNLTLTGTISSAAAVKVTKTGASVLTLSGDNSSSLAANSIWNVTGGGYNGSTGLYNNVVALNSGRGLGNAGGSVLNLDGGTLRFTTDGGTGYASSRTINVLAGGGAIDDGGFAFGEATAGQGAVSPAIIIASGASLSLVSSNKLVLSGVASGSGAVSKFGTGTAILSGANTYSGGTTINAGILQIGNGGTSGSLSTSGTITNNSSLVFNRTDTLTQGTNFSTAGITGTGSLTQSGLGTLVLNASNTYTGATNINAGTLNLAGSLANTAISVGSGAIFNPSLTASAGLSSGSAGASLTLSNGSIFDMTSASAGTINTFTLNPGSNTFSGQALNLAGANLRFDLGSSSADRLQVNAGTAVVSGTNNIRFNTGSSLTPGTYTLIGTTAASGLAGSFQFDGGSSLSVPAQQQIRQVGGTYYRLTLQNSATSQQVVVSAAPSNIINIMPLGSSITEGVTSQPGNTYAGGGYRSQLYQNLVNDGRFTPHFVGSQTVLDAQSNAGYNVLTGANELNHEGHSGYTTTQILKNLNANGGDGGNNGGSWLTPGNGKNPDYVTLSIGGNDYGANGSETTGPLNRTDAIVSQIASLRTDAQVIVSNLFYRTQTSGGNVVGDLQNTYYNPGVQGMVFNHVLAGQHVSFYDAYSAVTPGNNMSHIFDGIHPDTVGYQAFADGWYNALANGSAYWTGASGGQWSASTNFAQNYQLTTPRQGALGASTDVHFNGNAAPLNTTLGGDLSVRSVNFAAGATGAVTIGGPNTLTLGAGGITVQAGTGAHTISSNVVLGTNQTWGNVSSNPLAVTGDISGSGNLTVVGSAVVQVPGTLSGGTYTTTTQTVSGTGALVLSGANTYTGSTTISSGTLQIGNGGTTGSLSTSSAITNNGALVFNRTDTVTQGTTFSGAAITGSGSLTQAGTGTLVLNAANSYTGATAVQLGKLVVSGFIGNSAVTVTGTNTTLASGTTGTIGSSVTIHSGAILAAGDVNAAGTATVVGATTFNNGSIFSWDISSDGASYDKLVGASLVDGGGAGASVFRIVAADSSFTDTFWNSGTKTWANIFTTNGSSAISGWANIFTTVEVFNSGGGAITPVNGVFSVSGNTLTWSAVPEVSNVLIGSLLGLGLLRRRRETGAFAGSASARVWN